MSSCETFDFSRALVLLKEGKVVHRSGWSDGKCIYLQNDLFYVCKNIQWILSTQDILANDWCHDLDDEKLEDFLLRYKIR
jgi:hypothetical protein